jgi:microcystin-dependent protein
VAEPFLAEIRIMSFNFPPKGWAFCNGQLLPINQNQALFALLGTMYGGNAQTNFALPDLRNRVPLHVGNGRTQGAAAGETAHTLTMAEMPQHSHLARASNSANNGTPVAEANFLGSAANMYHSPSNLTAINPGTITNTGGSQAHDNMQPYLILGFCIALQGIFPSRN